MNSISTSQSFYYAHNTAQIVHFHTSNNLSTSSEQILTLTLHLLNDLQMYKIYFEILPLHLLITQYHLYKTRFNSIKPKIY